MITYGLLFITPYAEDRSQVAQLLAEESVAMAEIEFQMSWAEDLEEAIAIVPNSSIHVILLCLNLLKIQSMTALEQCITQLPHLPVVVFTGNKDETVRVQSLQLGACGYLIKDEIDSKLLVYSLRSAIAQKQQLQLLQQTQLERLQEEELLGLESISKSTKTNLTAKLFGLELLRDGSPEIFAEMVQQYAELMTLSLEQRAYKVEHNISEKLRNMGEQLGFLKASPRDAIELHAQALKENTQNVNPVKAQAYISEGRFMILELMGYLASYYRKYFIGLSKLNVSQTYQNPDRQ